VRAPRRDTSLPLALLGAALLVGVGAGFMRLSLLWVLVLAGCWIIVGM